MDMNIQKTRVRDTLLMAKGAGGSAPKLEETVEEINMKNEATKKALLGYA